jgi:shikimate kinase
MKLEDHIIALGGGALMRETNRQAIQHSGHQVIYLRCEPEDLFRRISADFATAANRPHLTNLGGTLSEVETLLAGREPTYRAAMTHEVDVTNLADEQVVAEIMRML